MKFRLGSWAIATSSLLSVALIGCNPPIDDAGKKPSGTGPNVGTGTGINVGTGTGVGASGENKAVRDTPSGINPGDASSSNKASDNSPPVKPADAVIPPVDAPKDAPKDDAKAADPAAPKDQGKTADPAAPKAVDPAAAPKEETKAAAPAAQPKI